MLNRAFKALAVVLILGTCVGLASDRGQPIAAANPLLSHALTAADRYWVVGDVETRVQAGHYTYLRLRGSGQPAWIVSLSATTPEASRVRALVIGRAEHFHSRRLQRDFSPLLFAAVRAASSDSSSQP